METNAELDLISKHRTMEKRIDDLKLDLSYCEEDKKTFIESEISRLTDERNSIEKELKNIPEKKISQIKRNNVLTVLRLIINKLKLNPGGHPISRDQGTVIHNAIYGYIIWDIKIGFNADYGGYTVPKYYHEVDGDFDHSKLKATLEVRYTELSNLTDFDYITIKTFVDGLANQIREVSWADKKQ